MAVERIPIGGMNVLTCPECNKGTFVPVTLEALAKIRVKGTQEQSVLCGCGKRFVVNWITLRHNNLEELNEEDGFGG